MPPMTHGVLGRLVELVTAHGMDPDRAATIAAYLADRCAGLSIASAHSSAHSSLARDPYLRDRLELTATQISAWLALVVGTRAVRRRGRRVGGHPGFIAAVATGPLSVEQRLRFAGLADRAAGESTAAPCRPVGRHLGRRDGRPEASAALACRAEPA